MLDRINPLLENPEHEFVLAECGGEKARVIVPHKIFRIFLSMNPSVGEVSRAMQNRCLEICLIPSSLNVSNDSAVLEKEQNSDSNAPNVKSLYNPKLDYIELLYTT